MSRNNRGIALIFIAFVVFALWLAHSIIKAEQSEKEQISYLEERIERQRDRYDREVAKRKAIEGSYKDLKESSDKEIAKLAEELSRATAAISTVTIRTTDTIYDTTTMVIMKDSLPVYVYNRATAMDTFDIVASMDSFEIKYSIVNQVLLEYRYEKRGLFKRELVVEATNSNPNTTTDSIAALYLEQPSIIKQVGVGVIAASLAFLGIAVVM